MAEKLPPFLRASVFKPLITKEIIVASSPIEFRLPTGTRAIGYDASLLPLTCELYIDSLEKGYLDERQTKFAASAKIVQKSLAKIGITALVDESCGYQELRDKNALQLLLDKYLNQEAAKWAKTFPDEFYLEIFRLKKWNPAREIQHRPGVIAKYTKDLVYARMAPNLVDMLEERNPITPTGHRASRHHQWLTKEQGVTHLKSHIYMLRKLMKSSSSWEDFMEKVNAFLPYSTTEDIEILENKESN